jgi:hypothetical protein
LLGSKLGGNLVCDGAQFTAANHGKALSADGLQADGGVFLLGIVAKGEVRFPGAKLGGGFYCKDAHFTASEDGKALFASKIKVEGDVMLRGVVAHGEVGLINASMSGDLFLSGKFSAKKNGRALNMAGAQVEGAFFLRGQASTKGIVDLRAARIGTMNDNLASWPSSGDLLLDRCRYGAFAGNAPVDAESRIRWLGLQTPRRWGHEFWPQPYEECARVLREGGHNAAARAVLIEKERLQRKARRDELARELARAHVDRDKTPPEAGFRRHTDRVIGLTLHFFALRVWDGILAWVVGYGRKPQNAALWALGFWLVGAFIFGTAGGHGAIKPNLPQVLRAPEWVECDVNGPRRGDWSTQYACFRAQPEAQSYPQFNALIYSADTLIPVVSFEMQSYWLPDDATTRGAWARAYLWLHIALGWALTVLAVAGFSGLIKQDGK